MPGVSWATLSSESLTDLILVPRCCGTDIQNIEDQSVKHSVEVYFCIFVFFESYPEFLSSLSPREVPGVRMQTQL